ncbi:MAG: hypothetical protein ABSE73_16240 [Planctomycetota bacterium]
MFLVPPVVWLGTVIGLIVHACISGMPRPYRRMPRMLQAIVNRKKGELLP